MNVLSTRAFNLLAALFCFGCLGFAYYSQYQMQLEPCPLCILQRVAMLALGIVFLLAAVHGPGRVGSSIYALLIAVAGGVGIAVAGRHVWLQHLPADQVPDCGPGFSYLLDNFGLSDAVVDAFRGAGECAEVDWTFIGLSMPEWVLLVFVGLLLTGLLWNLRKSRASTDTF